MFRGDVPGGRGIETQIGTYRPAGRAPAHVKERPHGTQWARIILFIAAALLAASAARAQDILNGKGIAQLWCSDCHLVDPQERKSGRNSVPTFLSIARMKSTTEAALAAFLSTPHGRGGMPDLVLNRKEIQDVSAYILSLRKLP